MKKILITSRSFGQVSNEPLRMLSDAGFDVEFYNNEFDELEFRKYLQSCDALIIGAHKLTEEAVKGAPNLKIISKHGAGLDNIDLDMTKKYGIHVSNVPAVNSNAVADLTFSLILDVARRTSFAANSVKNGNWERVIGVDVFGKNISIIGFGEIGKNVAKRALGFSMNVFVHDPFIKELTDEFEGYVNLVTFNEALEAADFLTLHIPLNNATLNLIGDKQIKQMKRGSFIINTSRGGIVDEDALFKNIQNGHLAGAGLDVLEQEPIEDNNKLVNLHQVVITPHMGMYSFEAINNVSLIAAKNVVDYFNK